MWLLIVTSVLAAPVSEGPERVGDVIVSQVVGYTSTLEECDAAGDELVTVFDEESGHSTLSVYNCHGVTAEFAARLADAQGWE